MSVLHIAAAAILNQAGQILLSLRPADSHQGGLWEFPGGKLESGEDVLQALRRELKEELDIEIQSARPLIKVNHQYEDRHILLDVWRVNQWKGREKGMEGQEIRWVPLQDIGDYAFPAADIPVINALKLPSIYMISPEPETGDPAYSDFLQGFEACLMAGLKLVQLRANELGREAYLELAAHCISLCQQYTAKCLLNTSVSDAVLCGAHGVHLSSQRLLQCSERPLDSDFLVSASCHNPMELEHAGRLGLDFVVLSPVNPTETHIDAETLGWGQFEQMAAMASLPVFALGGMQISDCEMAWRCGAQGISAIRSLWNNPLLADDLASAERTQQMVTFIS